MYIYKNIYYIYIYILNNSNITIVWQLLFRNSSLLVQILH